MHNKKLFGTSTVGTKGQVVIPVSAREELGINVGERMYVMCSPKKGFVLLLQEDRIEEFIEHMNLQLETFKTLKDEIKDEA